MGHICKCFWTLYNSFFMTNFSLYCCSQRFFFLLLLFPFETLLSYFINGPKNRAWHFFSPAGVWAINYGALNRDFVIHSWKHPFKFWLLWLLQCAVKTKSEAVAWEPIQVLQSCAKNINAFSNYTFHIFFWAIQLTNSKIQKNFALETNVAWELQFLIVLQSCA